MKTIILKANFAIKCQDNICICRWYLYQLLRKKFLIFLLIYDALRFDWDIYLLGNKDF